MSGQLLWTIIGTAATMGGMVVAALFFVIRLLIANDLSELRTTMATLAATADQLAREIQAAKVEQKEGRNELHDAVDAIRAMLHSLDNRVTVLESPATRNRRARIKASE